MRHIYFNITMKLPVSLPWKERINTSWDIQSPYTFHMIFMSIKYILFNRSRWLLREICAVTLAASHHHTYIHILLSCIARSGSYNLSILKCLLRQSFIFFKDYDLIVSYHAYLVSKISFIPFSPLLSLSIWNNLQG